MQRGALRAPRGGGGRNRDGAHRQRREELGRCRRRQGAARLGRRGCGGLGIFVANVSALAQSMDDESWRRSLEIDVMATVAGIEAAIPLLEQSTAGAIVVIGTTGAIEIAGPPRPYASAKAALVPYVKALARNLAAKNIRANMVSPGNVYFKGGVWNILEQSNPALFQTMVGRNPMGRMGTPTEVANAVVFLASPRAGFITGTNLIVDGALTQRVQF